MFSGNRLQRRKSIILFAVWKFYALSGGIVKNTGIPPLIRSFYFIISSMFYAIIYSQKIILSPKEK